MSKTLLLADDSVTIQKVVGITLASEDIELVTVDNGDDALVRARTLVPDVILADVAMPGLSGYELCAAVRAEPRLSQVPVLLLTGTFETYDAERAQSVGADAYIAKPFEAQALVDQVHRLLEQGHIATAPPAPQPAPKVDPILDADELEPLPEEPAPRAVPLDIAPARPDPPAAAPAEYAPPRTQPVEEPFDTERRPVIDAPPASDSSALDSLSFSADDFAKGDEDARPELTQIMDRAQREGGTTTPISSSANEREDSQTEPSRTPTPADPMLVPDPLQLDVSASEEAALPRPILDAGETIVAVNALPDEPDELEVDPASDPLGGEPDSANSVDAASFASLSGSMDSDTAPLGGPLDEEETYDEPFAAGSSHRSGAQSPPAGSAALGEPPVADDDGFPEIPEFPDLEPIDGGDSTEPGHRSLDATTPAPTPARATAPPSVRDLDPLPEPPTVIDDSMVAPLDEDDDVTGSEMILEGEPVTDPGFRPQTETPRVDLRPASPIHAPAPSPFEVTAPSPSEAPAPTPVQTPTPSTAEPLRTPPVDRLELRDSLEKIAWEALGPITEQLVAEVVKKVEAVVWEIVPEISERLVRAEIERLKSGDSGD